MIKIIVKGGCRFRLLLAARMELLMDLPEILAVDVGVDLRRGDVGVAEHLLYGAQVRPALEEMRREGVTEGMRRDMLGDARSLDVAAQDLPGAHAAQRL